MFDLIDGLPVHALVVHAVTVLVPLSVLGVLAIVLVPRWRERFGPLVAGIAVVATLLCPVATSSGEALERRVGDPGEHAHLGDQLVWFVLPLALLAVALVVLERRHRRAPAPSPSPSTAASTSTGASTGASTSTVATAPAPATSTGVGTRAVAVLAVLVALAAGVQVYRVGESGARAVWGDQVSAGR